MEEGAAASPTVMSEFTLITAAIDATGARDSAVINLPGAFLKIQTLMKWYTPYFVANWQNGWCSLHSNYIRTTQYLEIKETWCNKQFCEKHSMNAFSLHC